MMAFHFLSQANIHYVNEWFTFNWSIKFLIIRMHYQRKKSSRQNGKKISVDETDQLMTCRPNERTLVKISILFIHYEKKKR